jgi:hypothetical protein
VRICIIDGQVFQTAAWHRGMGKYSVELLAALQQLDSQDDWSSLQVVLSKRVTSEPDMLLLLAERLPKIKIVQLDLLPDEIGNPAVPEHNRRVIDAYVRSQQTVEVAVDFLILSVMQGQIYPTFPSIEGVTKLLLFYDLIPLMFHDMYLRNSITRHEYLPRIGELLRADIYLAISKTVANDLAVCLGIDRARIVSIDGGAIKHSIKQKPIKIGRPFILMPTGNDLRKNNSRAIMGFEAFNKAHSNAYALVITSFFKPHEIEELSKLSAGVIFVGNISGEELNYLYQEATALLFPPEYEGLGMPILEALEKQKPVACSNIAVFREMSKTAFNYFDPYLVTEISAALEAATSGAALDHAEYKRILARYTWKGSAEKLLAAIRQHRLVATAAPKQRLAVFGPDPAVNTEAGKLMQETHAELSRLFEIDYFIQGETPINEPRVNYLPYIDSVYEQSVGLGLEAEKYQIIIYHISNGAEFGRTMFAALGQPGCVVLHDTDLSETWRAIVDNHLVSTARIEIESQLEALADIPGVSHLAALLADQRSVIVFTEWQKALVERVAVAYGIHPKIVFVNRPVTTIVYDDALPEKTIPVGRASTAADKSLIDFRRDTIMNKLQVCLFDDHDTEQDLLEAMRYGVIPCVSAGGSVGSLSGIKLPTFQSLEKANQVAEKIAADDAKAASLSKDALEYTQRYHTERAFAMKIDEISGNSRQKKDKTT